MSDIIADLRTPEKVNALVVKPSLKRGEIERSEIRGISVAHN